MRLTRDFFENDSITVAQSLLGKELIFKNKHLIINETEAYIGFDDPASHAFKGKTQRNFPMFGEAGFSYIYMIYGMYFCLNLVTEACDFPAAILIRGGFNDEVNLDGPGKLCRYLNIDKKQNKRIGISKGKDKFWRFIEN